MRASVYRQVGRLSTRLRRKSWWRRWRVAVMVGNAGVGYVPPHAEYPDRYREIGRAWSVRGAERQVRRYETRRAKGVL